MNRTWVLIIKLRQFEYLKVTIIKNLAEILLRNIGQQNTVHYSY